jgi:mannose-6-phosphate isomerase
MTIEHARTLLVEKPWGRRDLRPWGRGPSDGPPVGEIHFERPGAPGEPEPDLLLKLLFTSEPLSIQVHPDDAYAHAIGLPRGKTEAWVILSAEAGATVWLGLDRFLTRSELHAAIVDGSIAGAVHAQAVAEGDVFFVAAGTIHAIGAGIVIAEIQQRSDATFRLFDHGRSRGLHVEAAMAVADAGPAARPAAARKLSGERSVLVVCPSFVLERIDMPPASDWRLAARQETWLLVLRGSVRCGAVEAGPGDAVYIDGQEAVLQSGDAGADGLLAYAAGVADVAILRRAAASPAPRTAFAAVPA